MNVNSMFKDGFTMPLIIGVSFATTSFSNSILENLFIILFTSITTFFVMILLIKLHKILNLSDDTYLFFQNKNISVKLLLVNPLLHSVVIGCNLLTWYNTFSQSFVGGIMVLVVNYIYYTLCFILLYKLYFVIRKLFKKFL